LDPRYYIEYFKGFWQRGTRGFADSDLWSLDHYIANILFRALPYYQNRHPDCHVYYFLDKDEYFFFEDRPEDWDEQQAMDEWDAMVDNIINTLYVAYIDPESAYDTKNEEAVQKVMADFAYYFGHFWN